MMNLAYGKFVNYLTETINPDLQHFFFIFKNVDKYKNTNLFQPKG